MRAAGYAAAHVNHNEVQVRIVLADLLGIAPCHCLLIQRMENRHTLDLRNAGDSRHRLQLIHNNGVYNVGRNAELIPDFAGQNAAQIGCMLALRRCDQVLKECVTYCVCAARDGL